MEKRNSFSLELEEVYIQFLMSSQDLKVFLEKNQIAFYKQRIKEIKEELEELEAWDK